MAKSPYQNLSFVGADLCAPSVIAAPVLNEVWYAALFGFTSNVWNMIYFFKILKDLLRS